MGDSDQAWKCESREGREGRGESGGGQEQRWVYHGDERCQTSTDLGREFGTNTLTTSTGAFQAEPPADAGLGHTFVQVVEERHGLERRGVKMRVETPVARRGGGEEGRKGGREGTSVVSGKERQGGK